MATIDLGDVDEIGFAFRTAADDTLTSPTGFTLEIRDPTGTARTALTDADPEVTIGASVGAALATSLGLSAAENAAGTGIVRILYTPDLAGHWQYHGSGTGAIVGAERVTTVVRAKFD